MSEKKEDFIQEILFRNYDLPPYNQMELEEATQRILKDYDTFYLNELQESDSKYFQARISSLREQEILMTECLDSYQNQLKLKSKIIKELRDELARNTLKEEATPHTRKGFTLFQPRKL